MAVKFDTNLKGINYIKLEGQEGYFISDADVQALYYQILDSGIIPDENTIPFFNPEISTYCHKHDNISDKGSKCRLCMEEEIR